MWLHYTFFHTKKFVLFPNLSSSSPKSDLYNSQRRKPVMKTHQKIQHRSPLRKSPRFSSPPSPSIHNSARPKPTPKTRPEDAWALSLHVAEQVPLRICYPSDIDDKPIRRSSRFTANKYKTPSPTISSPKPPYSSSSTQALTLRYGEDAPSSEKRRRVSEDGEATCRATKKTELGLDETTILRRSYRLKGGKVGNSAPQLLALPEPGSKSTEKCFLSEKHLRSRSVLMLKVEKVSTKVNSSIKLLLPPLVNQALVKSPEITVKGPVKSASSEKCLRPRSVKLSAGNVKTKDLTELPKNSRNMRINSLRGSQKDRGESSKQASPEKRAILSKKHLQSRKFKMQPQKETLVPLSEISRSGLRSSRKSSGEISEIESEKSAFSSEKCLSSRIVEMELGKESSETFPESSLRRSRKNSDESSEIKLERESLETLPEKPRSSLCKPCKNSDESLEIESKRSSFSGEKCLSSRSVEMELEKESSKKIGYVRNEKRSLSPLIESVLDELFGISEETDGEKSDSDAASEECLK